MAKPYTITIENGEGTAQVLNDQYTVTSSVTGYNDTSIDPKSLTVVEGTNAYNLTIAAEGALTIHVTEDGTTTGTPVVGAVFYRADSAGTTYGSPVTTNAEGNATLENLPYDSTTPQTVYIIQTASDGSHEFDKNVQTQSLSTQTTTIEVINSPAVTRTFTLTDANYENLSISSGTITLS